MRFLFTFPHLPVNAYEVVVRAALDGLQLALPAMHLVCLAAHMAVAGIANLGT